MGTGQTYTTLIIEAATLYGHLNVFKHEWGHSLLSYYEASGAAPTPTVTNHAVVNQYVNCTTGNMYVWLDETDANPIPNSIYNNESGFTHDYYSGTTALANDPMHCLGITPSAWATGGPVSMPGGLKATTAAEKVQAMRRMLQHLVEAGTLRRSWSRPLENLLDNAAPCYRRRRHPHRGEPADRGSSESACAQGQGVASWHGGRHRDRARGLAGARTAGAVARVPASEVRRRDPA